MSACMMYLCSIKNKVSEIHLGLKKKTLLVWLAVSILGYQFIPDYTVSNFPKYSFKKLGNRSCLEICSHFTNKKQPSLSFLSGILKTKP